LVPVDFMTERLEQRLHDSGYDASRRTLFIWEGVTMYLSSEAVDDTLAFVRTQSKSGSSIIFDYALPSVISGSNPRREAKVWRKGATRYGEHLLFGLDENDVEAFLTQRGFAQVRNATHATLKQRHFQGLNQRRAITPIMAIVHAVSVG
jgi:methyltransferase (TIGR00027 family)